jgi:predicted secreted hydrolase
MIGKVLILLLLFPSAAIAQGFADLGRDVEGFDVPVQGHTLTFPNDHGAHPGFRIEWWYVTANLIDDAGTQFGVQWTLFRSALKPKPQNGWQDPTIWMGHAALTTPDRHFVGERLSRGGIGQAGVTTAPFSAWIDEWQLYGPTFENLSMTAATAEFSFQLELTSQGPLILHGNNGYSVKSEQGQASYYYAQPAYKVHGKLNLPSGPTEVTGSAWLDREWSSQPLSEDQTGWDWFSLSFSNGTRLMAFQLRGAKSDFISGTWISETGETTPLKRDEILLNPLSTSEVSDRTIPTQWSLSVPRFKIDVTVSALNNNAWMETSFPYWEGPVNITGNQTGVGYLEMTGY